MFTGIIENTGIVKRIIPEGSNIRFSIECSFTSELKIDQSVSHNGICLTVVAVEKNIYEVVAIDETLKRTNLGDVKSGDEINLERCLKVSDRLDGHIVQGHVDCTATLTEIKENEGSWSLYFTYENSENITVEKGSVCLNGVSLTVVDSAENTFSVAIIPYTWEHTNFKTLKAGDKVNVEFDIIGKYVRRILAASTKY